MKKKIQVFKLDSLTTVPNTADLDQKFNSTKKTKPIISLIGINDSDGVSFSNSEKDVSLFELNDSVQSAEKIL